MADWAIELRNQKHERDALDCGTASLDSFLKRFAWVNMELGVSRVWVATRPGEKRVVGFYAASAGVFQRDDLAPGEQAGLPRYPLPTAHLGRLAVDRSWQGQRLGETLLFHFLKMVREVSEKLAIYAVDLWAKDDPARRFYSKYSFRSSRDDPLHLYLPMATVRQMFEQP